MSGWIKIEKDLEDDPRVLRIAKRLGKRFAVFDMDDERNRDSLDLSNALALQAVTLVCGAMQRIWRYADSHARADDTLDCSAEELDDLVGIPGFCALMPDDWLVSVDDKTVELPNFHAHNGIEAKKRAQNQKRQERHRDKVKRNGVTGSNAPALTPALLDQDHTKTRPDQDLHTEARRKSTPVEAGRFPPAEHLQRIIAAYPKFTGRQDWITAAHHIEQRLSQGDATIEELEAAVHRYAAYVAAGGVSSPQYVIRPAIFFSAADKPWAQPWTPPPSKAQVREDENVAAGQAFLAAEEAKDAAG